jgi:hypothetical protein
MLAGTWPLEIPCERALPEPDLYAVLMMEDTSCDKCAVQYAGDEMWLHATVVPAWRVAAQPPCLLLHSTAGFLAAAMSRREVTHNILFEERQLSKPASPANSFFFAFKALRQVNTQLRSGYVCPLIVVPQTRH